MFPLRDKHRTTARPWITIGLIVVNAAAFVHELSLSPRELDHLVTSLGLTPARLADPRWRAELGFGLRDFWPFFTSLFLHGGLLHVASNLWFLWIFGDNVEERFGSLRFLFFYLLCGFAAGMLHVIVEPHSSAPAIGASGAIAGVMGAYLRLFPRGRIITIIPIFIFPLLVEVPALLFLGLWFLLQLFGASVGKLGGGDPAGGVAFWAHVGGFLAGAVLVPVFARRNPERSDWNR
ncbi:MAG TPA: rhomboid family intramembrane serine protease [Planctomycetota bacterium]|nr:rhomboid family intramembrane serine protease [Planctomycetota bacterium]